jgi:inhibitor of cysteine peptidase
MGSGPPEVTPMRTLGAELVVLVTALLLAGCGPGADVVALAAADRGSSVELAVGDVIEVALDSNPSTGYDWHLDALDETVVAVAGEPRHEPADGGLGAGGVTTWRFEAVAPGVTDLRLVYDRVWEAAPPEATFEVAVRVRS